VVLLTHAQSPFLKDSIYQQSFGVEKPIVFKVPILNKGNGNLYFSEVKHPYNNIEVRFPESPIKPNEIDSVTIEFWPYKIGFFKRNMVFSYRYKKNGVLKNSPLTIAGEVSDEKAWSSRFPYSTGNLRYDKRTIYFGKSMQGSQVKNKIRFVNPTSKNVKLDLKIGYSDQTMVEIPENRILKPGEIYEVPVILSTRKIDEYGYHEEPFTLIDKSTGTTLNFTSKALIISNARFVPFVSPELDLALEDDTVRLGKVGEDESVDVLLEIQNNGKSELEIYRIEPVETVEIKYLVRVKVPPGESTHMMMVVHDPNFYGEQTRSIGIYSNDPKKPLVAVHIQAEYP
jgi:hypothetical protein